MGDFTAYHQHNEALIDYLADRLEEDDVLAGTRRFPKLYRATNTTQQMRNLHDYRRAAARAMTAGGATQYVWRHVAHYHAMCARLAARPYASRPGFDQSWL